MARYLRDCVQHLQLPIWNRHRRPAPCPGGRRAVAEKSTGRVRARHVVLSSGPSTAGGSRLPRRPRPRGLTAALLRLPVAGRRAARRHPRRRTCRSRCWALACTGGLTSPTASTPTRTAARPIHQATGDVVGRQLRALVRERRVRLLPHRVVRARGRQVHLAEASPHPVSSVLWCTGLLPDTFWIDVPGATRPRVRDARGGCAPGGGAGWACRGRPGSTARSSSAWAATPAPGGAGPAPVTGRATADGQLPGLAGRQLVPPNSPKSRAAAMRKPKA
jgi:hypothetical protein